MKRIARRTLLGVLGLAVAIQAVPYGRDHANPPVLREPPWDSPRTRALAVRACFDCHSNETKWPWYSHVAPISWLIQRDVDEGRQDVNFSEWGRPQEEAKRCGDTVCDMGMPPPPYARMHAEARLTYDERCDLARGLRLTLGE